MCTWFSDKLDAAMAQGMEQGREEGLIEAYNRMVANGTPESEAKRILCIQ